MLGNGMCLGAVGISSPGIEYPPLLPPRGEYFALTSPVEPVSKGADTVEPVAFCGREFLEIRRPPPGIAAPRSSSQMPACVYKNNTDYNTDHTFLMHVMLQIHALATNQLVLCNSKQQINNVK